MSRLRSTALRGGLIGLWGAACLLGPGPARAGAIDYAIGPRSADIRFHTLVAGAVPVDGAFTRFAGHILLDPGGSEAVRIVVTVQDDAMDVPFGGASMLRTKAYFDYKDTPEIRFTSDHAAIGADGHFIVAGQLTIRGLTRPEELTGTVTHGKRDGVAVLLMAAHGRLDRTQYGMVADRPLIDDGVELRITAALRLP